MKSAFAAIVLAGLGLSSAAPAVKRANTPAGVTDAVILNYALTLEHLENTFYRQGLANFTENQFKADGFSSDFYKNLKVIAADEQIHVEYLTKGLTAAGAKPVAECVYNFMYKTPREFVALASILEGVGVSAYVGAAAAIVDSEYLTAAGSILAIEARHSSFIRGSLIKVPFPSPFDTPLDFNQVYSLAAPMIVCCPPTNAPLPVKAFPTLTLANVTMAFPAKPIVVGNTLTFKSAAPLVKNTAYYIYFLNQLKQNPVKAFVGAENMVSAVIPVGVEGVTYVVLSTNEKKASDENIISGPAIVEIETAPIVAMCPTSAPAAPMTQAKAEDKPAAMPATVPAAMPVGQY